MRRAAALSLVLLSACTSYEEKPLLPEELLQAVLAERATLASEPQQGVDAQALAKRLLDHSPELRRLRAQANIAAQVAKVPTPFPNPMLATGVQAGFGPMVDTRRAQGLLGVEWDIPLDDRLDLQDQLKLSRAKSAQIEVEARAQELLRELHVAIVEAVAARERRQLSTELALNAQESAALAARLAKSGLGSAFDASMLHADAIRMRMEAAEAERMEALALGRLTELTSLPLAGLQASLPEARSAPPECSLLHTLFLQSSPALARLRSAYLEAEAALRLQIQLQYPTLKLGSMLNGEPNDNMRMLDLTLGVSLPLFDRNQPAIAEALARREAVREEFHAALAEGLATLDARLTELTAATQLLQTSAELLPAADKSVSLARQGLQAGVFDPLKLLEAQRTQRQARLAELAARLAQAQALARLDQALGTALPHGDAKR